uniref:Uncharacterized protein n=1 Tax=Trichogramma kaykai TaxID=54128 RepID=A0ABD2WR96_9HYME
MSTFWTFSAIFAALYGIIIVSSVSLLTILDEATFIDRWGENHLVLSESGVENTTIYYALCDRYMQGRGKKGCTLYRNKVYSEDAKCNITLRFESGRASLIPTHLITIEPLGKDRAIVSWFVREYTPEMHLYNKSIVTSHLRLSIVNFSNCKIKTTKVSEDLNRLIMSKNDYKLGFAKLRYLKGEDEFEVLSASMGKVYRSSIDAEGVASPVDTLLTYPEDVLVEPLIVPLSKDKGYLFIESPSPHLIGKKEMAVALIQPNGQRENLTRIEGVDSPLVSLVNGLIGICARQNETTMKCTQFKLGDKEIDWFSANISCEDYVGCPGIIYNLPEGEGFLTVKSVARSLFPFIVDEYPVKIGLDGKPTQLVFSRMGCAKNQDHLFTKLSQDDEGHYRLSSACVKYSSYKNTFDLNYLWFSNYIYTI